MGASQSSRRRGNDERSETDNARQHVRGAPRSNGLDSDTSGPGRRSGRRGGGRRRNSYSLFRGSSSSSLLQGSDDARATTMTNATSGVDGDDSKDGSTSPGGAALPSRGDSGAGGGILWEESSVTDRPSTPPQMLASLTYDEFSYVSPQTVQESIEMPAPPQRRASALLSDDDDLPEFDFVPSVSCDYEWMTRSLDTLALGHMSRAPVLALSDEDDDEGVKDSPSRLFCQRWSFGTSRGSIPILSRRGDDHGSQNDGTMASSFDRNRQRRNDGRNYASHPNHLCHDRTQHKRNGGSGGPNVIFSLLAREITGKPTASRSVPVTDRLRAIGGQSLYTALDKPAGGMPSETALLREALQRGDWTETQTIVSRLAPRLIGDPSSITNNTADGERGHIGIDDPSLPASASRYYAGGGRLGFEREAFVLSGGVELFIRIFREHAFVGDGLIQSNDARDLSEEMVATKLAGCWNEVLASLRELAYVLPSLVDNGSLLERGDFLPFLFTLLAHDSCFDGAATLIEEILSFQSQAPQPSPPSSEDGEDPAEGNSENASQSAGHVSPATTFFLGNVPDLYELWGSFNCRQLAHFCRILALLVFEPEDRLLLESPAVLKSLELLQLRRDRAVRAGRDVAVDMNQAILLGDKKLIPNLVQLLRIMNYAPSLSRSSAYHVIAHFPWIADTLVMLGLNELESWSEIDRLDGLARKMMTRGDEDSGTTQDPTERSLSALGSVADMLESLSSLLSGNAMEPATQLGHIIHVINAAQQAGVVVGRQRRARPRRRNPANNTSTERSSQTGEEANVAASQVGDDTSEALALPDQVRFRRLYAAPAGGDLGENDTNAPVQVVGIEVNGMGETSLHTLHNGRRGRIRINNPEDAANELQFNSLLLAPYQVEVLFVLCTLLGGRRKVDAQRILKECGLIPVLDEMFYRLAWGAAADSSMRQSHSTLTSESGDGNSSPRPGEINDGAQQEETQQTGIHGPGCECNPESALRVQYLRLLHNYCDRDCDNYGGRRLLLSPSERDYVLSQQRHQDPDRSHLQPGLLSKVLQAFVRERDDSPYRFWLASCAESYLRGSSPQEQVFAAQSGLLDHLIEDVISDRLHCAGSLQTAFDLLGELCRGNAEVLQLLVRNLDEEGFRRLMSVAASNLVDSNVFIRSLLLTVEKIGAHAGTAKLHENRRGDISASESSSRWSSAGGQSSRHYLTHSWWDSMLVGLDSGDNAARTCKNRHGGTHPTIDEEEEESDASRPSDWYPSRSCGQEPNSNEKSCVATGCTGTSTDGSYLNDSVGHCGWVFSPSAARDANNVSDWGLSESAYRPNSVERLSWFLAANQCRLLRDLLSVVDLRNINHENICCLNTAVVVAIFAYRRQELPRLLHELRNMNDEEKGFIQAMKALDIDDGRHVDTRDISTEGGEPRIVYGRHPSSSSTIGDRADVLRNFRELLWFWSEYYTHRGRDRLSLEFSSHLRFQEWKNVVSLLTADDGSITSLVRNPVRLPQSPYTRAARLPLRGS